MYMHALFVFYLPAVVDGWRIQNNIYGFQKLPCIFHLGVDDSNKSFSLWLGISLQCYALLYIIVSIQACIQPV